MKLLRDFFRLRTSVRPLSGRRVDARRSWTITVPAPLNPAQAPTPVTLDMHWNADAKGGRPVAHWHEHAAPQAHRHLQLVSSH
ncbi:hypothetical protein DVT68_08875 [Dyella solisilvae]|uniref:Uncharacterized protein n=1 Tax=Dyella solisilvae TaxID=1920168 RepID=A0A370K7K3_9GAMM|nr:hypothetical protein [Dyella solisilvae]RDI98628.1 hypothetical protein DVT68_08875 [Dyella solisilvae]